MAKSTVDLSGSTINLNYQGNMRRFAFAAALALLVAPAALQAQNTPAEKEVYAVVEKFFEGFNAKDTTAMRSHLLGDFTLLTTFTNQQGQPVARAEKGDDFMKAIGGAPVKLFEKIFEPVVQVEDGLATVWVRYEFYADDKYSHCGIDAFVMAKTANGWKIASIADTRRKQCDKK
jgi:ketosteroid isomerase-like protein